MERGPHVPDPKGAVWASEEIRALRTKNELLQSSRLDFACADLEPRLAMKTQASPDAGIARAKAKARATPHLRRRASKP